VIRVILILLLVSMLGWGIGHAARSYATRSEAPVATPSVSLHRGDFSAIQERMHSDVVLYTLSDCTYSKQAKAFFDAQGIAYAELDVGESLDARQEAKSLGATSVPFMLVGDIGVEGFDQAQLMAVLDQPPVK
jgi:glutaredoxin